MIELPSWASDLNDLTAEGDTVMKVERVAKRIVVAVTRRGAVVIRKPVFGRRKVYVILAPRPVEYTVPSKATTYTTPDAAALEPIVERALDRDVRQNYVGDSHPLKDMAWVSGDLAKKLARFGITTTDQLCRADTAGVADIFRAPMSDVALIQAIAELMKVKGIGEQIAELLARSGVTGVRDLRGRSSTSIANAVAKFVKRHPDSKIGFEVSAARVEQWKSSARDLATETIEPIMPRLGALSLDEKPDVKQDGASGKTDVDVKETEEEAPRAGSKYSPETQRWMGGGASASRATDRVKAYKAEMKGQITAMPPTVDGTAKVDPEQAPGPYGLKTRQVSSSGPDIKVVTDHSKASRYK